MVAVPKGKASKFVVRMAWIQFVAASGDPDQVVSYTKYAPVEFVFEVCPVKQDDVQLAEGRGKNYLDTSAFLAALYGGGMSRGYVRCW
jgi:hypothetical protein